MNNLKKKGEDIDIEEVNEIDWEEVIEDEKVKDFEEDKEDK